MQVEGEKKQDIEIRVSPKIYSEKRLEKEFQKARKELAKVISGENKDLSHIKTESGSGNSIRRFSVFGFLGT